MGIDRRLFNLGITAATLGAMPATPRANAGPTGAADTRGSAPPQPAHGQQRGYFFSHPTFEFVYLVSLGRAYQMAGNVGKILYLGKRIEDGNFESAFTEFKQAGDEARALAQDSLSRGHRESARQAFLWAQNYYDSSTYFLDGSNDPGRFLATWESLYQCWLSAVPLFDPPIEAVQIPYEGTHLHGFHFKGRSKARKRPLLILANGSDGSLLDMWAWSASGATARGYDCLTFDGPGQGHALWKQNLHFRPDWENVITPVVDYALSRADVDPKRIAIQGISQGGYWVPRAVAFEKRIAAAIADPGVVDVSTSWTASLPPPLLGLLKAGRKTDFDGFMAKALDPATKANLNFRMRPYGFTSYFDMYQAVAAYNLRAVAGKISCPLLITAPVNESFWPGQSQQLYDLVTSAKKLVPFSESDGADLHCEPQATGLRDLRVFDWLDETLRV